MVSARTVRHTLSGDSVSQVNMALRLSVLGAALLLQGCLQQPKPVVPAGLSPAPPARTTLMTEALAEAEDLRAAMAAVRIKAAKQTAALRTAQGQVSTLRNREIEHVATIAHLEKELSTIRTERDGLQKEVTDLRAQAENIPQLLKMVAHVRIMETSMKGMMSSIDALSNETAQLKKQITQQRAAGIKTHRSIPSGLTGHGPHAGNRDFVVVKAGDSLWRLARRYGTTVAELKTLNDLDRDLILVGQILNVPSPAHSLDEPDPVEPLKANNQTHNE